MAKQESVQRICYRSGVYLRRRAPTILTIIGSAGVVVTAVLAARATPKALHILEETREEKNKELTVLETILEAGPVYFPAVAMGTASILCIVGSNLLNHKTQQSLASAYALMDRGFKEYRNKLIELHGEEVDLEVRNALAREHCEYHIRPLEFPDDKKLTFYEPISKQTIRCYERELLDAEYHLNRNFVLGGCASINDFLYMLGLDLMDGGDNIGWDACDGYYWVDFEHRLVSNDDGSEFYIIDTVFPPNLFEDWV